MSAVLVALCCLLLSLVWSPEKRGFSLGAIAPMRKAPGSLAVCATRWLETIPHQGIGRLAVRELNLDNL